jgi:hypothetical protein
VRGRPRERTFISLFSLEVEFAILMIAVELSVERLRCYGVEMQEIQLSVSPS